MYDTKIAMVIRDDLPVWQKLNVAAFLASAVAVQFPETHGRPLVNASGTTYLPFLKHPIIVFKADDTAQLQRAHQRAKDRELAIGAYTAPLFATKNEDGNVTEMLTQTDDTQDLVGLIVYGEIRKVDKALSGLKFHS